MIGRKLAHYEIIAHLGSGAMGDVYQATDTKLGRSVALKFLPDEFAHDSSRTARLIREARALASLNHPNIAAIHGLEESDNRSFLVMELVQGQTLDVRLRQQPMTLDEALAVARQMAEALEAAHDKGVSIGISSPPTSRSRRTDRSRCWTLVWPSSLAMRRATQPSHSVPTPPR